MFHSTVFVGIKQFYMLVWFKKTRLETPFRGDNVKALVVMDGTMAQIFFKPEKNLEFFRLKICAIDAYPGKLE